MSLFLSNIKHEPWNFCFKVFLIPLLCVNLGLSQNEVIRTIDPSGIDRIFINGDQIFEIEVYSENRDTIELHSLIDGEYENDFQIHATKANTSLEVKLVSSDFSYIPDDKRNAHKVVAATVKLIIPHNFQVEVVSDVGFLIAKGTFSSLLVSLQTGYVSFEGLVEYLRAETLEGNIYLTSSNMQVEANSTQGHVSGVNSLSGSHKALLRTIKGDIIVKSMDR